MTRQSSRPTTTYAKREVSRFGTHSVGETGGHHPSASVRAHRPSESVPTWVHALPLHALHLVNLPLLLFLKHIRVTKPTALSVRCHEFTPSYTTLTHGHSTIPLPLCQCRSQSTCSFAILLMRRDCAQQAHLRLGWLIRDV
jgi:hypothetical protein